MLAYALSAAVLFFVWSPGSAVPTETVVIAAAVGHPAALLGVRLVVAVGSEVVGDSVSALVVVFSPLVDVCVRRAVDEAVIGAAVEADIAGGAA